MSEETKKCPYCAETIKAEAVICRFCKSDLSASSQTAQAPNEKVDKKKNSGLVWFIVILVVFLLIGAVKRSVDRTRAEIYSNLSGISGDYSSGSSSSLSETYRVEYKISGTASRVSLTYENAQGGTEQTEVSVPWRKSLTVEEGDFVYISAQNQGDSGSVTCEIWVDGKKWKTSTSSGAYVIASCSGSAGRD